MCTYRSNEDPIPSLALLDKLHAATAYISNIESDGIRIAQSTRLDEQAHQETTYV